MQAKKPTDWTLKNYPPIHEELKKAPRTYPVVVDRSRLPLNTQGEPVKVVMVDRWEFSDESNVVRHEREEGTFRTDFFGLVETYDERESWFIGIPLPFVFPVTSSPLAKRIADFMMGVLAFLSICLLSGVLGN